MSVKKNNYKVVELKDGLETVFTVKKRVLCFFWTSVKNKRKIKMFFETKRSAQAYINFLK
jgi:hypothetical protein